MFCWINPFFYLGINISINIKRSTNFLTAFFANLVFLLIFSIDFLMFLIQCKIECTFWWNIFLKKNLRFSQSKIPQWIHLAMNTICDNLLGTRFVVDKVYLKWTQISLLWNGVFGRFRRNDSYIIHSLLFIH